MKLILIFILIPAIGITRSIHKFIIPQCNKYGIKCLDKDTFTFCSTFSQFIIIQVDGLKCPYGYMCQDASQYPCTLDPEFGENGCIPTSTTTPELITLTEPTNASAQVTTASETFSNTNTESYETTFKTTKDIQDYSIDNAETTTSTRTSSSLDFSPSSISEGTTSILTTMQLSTSRYDTSTSTTEETLSTFEFSSEKTSVDDESSTSTTNTSSSTLIESTTMELFSDSEEETGTTLDNIITRTTVGETSTSKFVFTSTEDANEVSTDIVTKTTGDTRTSSKSTSLRSTRQPVGPPTCSNYALYPGPTCNQYYECQMYWLLWYIPVLKSCPTEQSFSTTKSLCVPSSESNCID